MEETSEEMTSTPLIIVSSLLDAISLGGKYYASVFNKVTYEWYSNSMTLLVNKKQMRLLPSYAVVHKILWFS